MAQDERCEFCAADIGERHGHVADITDHRLLCVCRPCYLLFAPHGAGGGRYRGVGEEVRRVGDLVLDDARWDSLRVPVDLVFFFRQTGAGHLLAFYPGPDGATESELDLASWDDISGANPVLDNLERDVEAVLLRRHEDELLLLPRADRPLLRAGRRGAQQVDRAGRRARGVARDRCVLRRARRPRDRRGPGRRESSRRDERGVNGATGTDGADRLAPVDVDFTCEEVVADRYAAGPTVVFKMRATETSGAHVHALALRCQARVEPVRRSYSDSEAAQVVDLFGERSRWGQTMQTMQLAFMTQVLPGFTGSTTFELVMPCSYDIEVAAHKYLAGLEDGLVPLVLLFSGTVFTGSPGTISVVPVPWHKEASVRMPVHGVARGDGRALPGAGLAAPRARLLRPPRRLPRKSWADGVGRSNRRVARGGG